MRIRLRSEFLRLDYVIFRRGTFVLLFGHWLQIILFDLCQERFITNTKRLRRARFVTIMLSQSIADLLSFDHSHGTISRLAQITREVEAKRFQIACAIGYQTEIGW